MKKKTPTDIPAWCNRLFDGYIFWRFQIEDRRLELLSPGKKSGFSEIIPPLLTDLRFAATVVAEEDFLRFKYFIQHLRQGTADQITFRLVDQLGKRRLGRLESVALEQGSPFLFGFFLNISRMLPDSLNETAVTPSSEKKIRTESQYTATLNSISMSTDIPALLADLCQQQERSDPVLFDALAVLLFSESEDGHRWRAHGFDNEEPDKNEIDHLIVHLRRSFDQPNPSPLVANNTAGSSMPLDWAIFVRCGLLSYRIEPLLQRRRARGAVIFASRQSWRYHLEEMPVLGEVILLLQGALSQP